VGSLVMMIIISPLLVLVFAITLPISLLFTRVMIKKTSKYFKARSHNLGLLSGFNEEMITGSKTIKAYGKEKEIIEKFNQFNADAANASYMAEYYSAYTGPGVNFVNNLSLSLICLFGAILTKKQMLLLGDISSFVLYSKKFSGPINEIANIVTDLQSALAAAERVFELIDEKEELKDEQNAISLDVEDGNVSFKNVYFGYSANKLILKDISFDALSGKQIAIVGPTGSGKTTIVNLLMRFYDINSGAIYLDDNNIQMIKRKDLRLSYAMVLQDTWLFEGTVFDNLIYGNDNVTFDDVKNAATAARIDTFIESLPNGYDTILSEGGTNISKGQKQLLTIARAMLLDAKMLILDEATSNVDTRTEIKIQEAMKNLMKDKTSFIIAHRLSTIKNADTILVIKDGEIVEQGNHIELLNKNGFYKELYISQFNN
jgi:ATP-binding cassette subfamily B protein